MEEVDFKIKLSYSQIKNSKSILNTLKRAKDVSATGISSKVYLYREEFFSPNRHPYGSYFKTSREGNKLIVTYGGLKYWR